jgi:hypothetical protein
VRQPARLLERPDWNGTPVHVCDLFSLKNDRGRHVTCKLRTHECGWELRLFAGAPLELVQAQVCRSGSDVLTLGELWKAKLIESGWRPRDLDG